MSQWDNIPTWEELLDVRTWVMRGCPAAGDQFTDTRLIAQLLWKLIEGLPKHIPIYNYGSPEWSAELEQLRTPNDPSPDGVKR